MTGDIFLWLTQDGVTNGAIYALLALALLLVFAVTRVIFVPQGEFITFAALSLAFLEAGRTPGTLYILVFGGLAAAAIETFIVLRERAWRSAVGAPEPRNDFKSTTVSSWPRRLAIPRNQGFAPAR